MGGACSGVFGGKSQERWHGDRCSGDLCDVAVFDARRSIARVVGAECSPQCVLRFPNLLECINIVVEQYLCACGDVLAGIEKILDADAQPFHVG